MWSRQPRSRPFVKSKASGKVILKLVHISRDGLSKTMNQVDAKEVMNCDGPDHDKISTAKSIELKNMKKAKTINYLDENGEIASGDNSDLREKENVFNRLAKRKTLSMSKELRKKASTPQPQVNFFDNHYKSAIVGIFISNCSSKAKRVVGLCHHQEQRYQRIDGDKIFVQRICE